MSGRESASRTLPRMRIGCGRLVAVLWTLLRKTLPFLGSTTKVGFFCDKPPQPLCRRIRLRAAQRGVRSGREEAVAGGRIPCAGKTYTFHAQDVYVSRSKRIRFHRQTYTFCSRYVYVLMRRSIRSARATDEAATLSEGERQSKGASFGRRTWRPTCRQGIQQAPSRRHEDGCWGLCFSGSDPRAGAAGRYIRERRSWALLRSSLPSMEAPKE